MSRLSRLVLSAACAASLVSCGRGGISLSFSADPALMPRLQAIIAALPPPGAWKLVADPASADYLVSLAERDAGAGPASLAVPCGTEYLAASASLSDDLYSVSARRAEEIGLERLEAIVPPRRALAVDGLWPPSPGYPFARRLLLSAAARRGGALPRELGRWVAEAAARAESSDEAPLLLDAVGDVQVGEGQGRLLARGREGIRSLLGDGVLDRLRRADLAVANLEGPISSRGEPNPRKRYRFRMPSGASAALEAAGFGMLLFGNNHAFDFGPEAFSDTLDELEKTGLPMVGAGRDLAEAGAARFVEPRRGERLAFVGYAFFPDESLGFTRAEAAAGPGRPGIAADEGAALAAVREARASGAAVVVLAHGGAEYQRRPSDAARALYAKFADAGAALVLGSHPHLLQGCEARSGSLIAYSLGNFLFTGEEEPPEALKGAMLDFLIYRGAVRGLRPCPIVAGYDRTEIDDDREGAEARFSRLCAELAELPPLKAGR
jgi:poly-gamma-glutamate capsule biosynthesis protein CapA/YwtB (metallophosphatase superfamily)